MRRGPFVSRLLKMFGAFVFPICGDGIFVLIGTWIFLGACDVLARLFPVGSILLIFCSGYLAAYFYEVVRATAKGDDIFPQWPSLVSWMESIVEPLIMFCSTVILSFAPVLIYIWRHSYSLHDPMFFVCAMISILVFPAVLMSVIFEDSLGGLLPWKWIKMLSLDFGMYLLIVIIFVLVALIDILPGKFLRSEHWEFVLYGINTAMTPYELFVCSRCCGLYLRTNQDSLLSAE